MEQAIPINGVAMRFANVTREMVMQNQIQDIVCNTFIDMCDVRVGPDVTFDMMGLDSLDLAHAIADIEDSIAKLPGVDIQCISQSDMLRDLKRNMSDGRVNNLTPRLIANHLCGVIYKGAADGRKNLGPD